MCITLICLSFLFLFWIFSNPRCPNCGKCRLTSLEQNPFHDPGPKRTCSRCGFREHQSYAGYWKIDCYGDPEQREWG